MPKHNKNQPFENESTSQDLQPVTLGGNSSGNACGRLLRDRRQERGLSLTSLAEVLGISKSHLSMLESGYRLSTGIQFFPPTGVQKFPLDQLIFA